MDLAATHCEVVRISVESLDSTGAWDTLVTYLELLSGSSLPTLRGVDVHADVGNLQLQLRQLVQTEAPPDNLSAVYFGLFDTIDDDDVGGVGFYVAGIRAFDPNEGDSLCNPDWWPEGRYLSSATLDAIKAAELAAESSENDELNSLLGYAGQLGAALILVRFAAAEQFAGLKRVVGFDSGDFAELPT